LEQWRGREGERKERKRGFVREDAWEGKSDIDGWS
jgi:hypothetical protein